jgi:hypothetical protein
MQSFAGSGRFIECSGRIVLWCGECGEALVLLGCEEDWRSERALFKCHCGQKLTLANRRDEGVLTPEEEHTAKELLQSLGPLDTMK